jgi:rhodanese-related sulfurtransferase
MMTTTAAQMVAEAKGQIQNLTPEQVAEEMRAGAKLIDLREPGELETNGRIPGAIPAPRGMLEFYADPTSPYHREEFDPNQRLILSCASGGRSALATVTLRRMGYTKVAHLDGGLNAWKAQGLPVDDAAVTPAV